MLFPNTILRVNDNSGVRKIKCINVPSIWGFATEGDVVLAVIQRFVLNKKKNELKFYLKG